MAAAILALQSKAATRGITCGILARNEEEAGMRRDQGFQMIGLGADINLMMRSLQRTFAALQA